MLEKASSRSDTASSHGSDRSGSTTSSNRSSSCYAAGGALKRTCSSLSLLSDLTSSSSSSPGSTTSSSSSSCTTDGGSSSNDGTSITDDDVEPPDHHHHHAHDDAALLSPPYSPDFGTGRHNFSSTAKLYEHLRTELHLSSSAPTSSNERVRDQSKLRRRILSKLKRRRRKSTPAQHYHDAAFSSSPSSSRSSSASAILSSSSSGGESFPVQKSHRQLASQTWPLRDQGVSVEVGGNAGSSRRTARSSSKSPFSRVRRLLRKKNRSLALSRDPRVAADDSSAASASGAPAESAALFFLDSNGSSSSENSRFLELDAHHHHRSYHQFSHTCTHCGRTHTLHATLTTTVTAASSSSSSSSAPTTNGGGGHTTTLPHDASASSSTPRTENEKESESEAGNSNSNPSPNPDESDLFALSTADDPLSGTTQYCCKNSAADSDLFPIQEGKLMLTRNPSDAFPSSYKLQLRCSHFEESLLHQWFECDHYVQPEHASGNNNNSNGSSRMMPHHLPAPHHTTSTMTEVCEYCSAECSLCAHDLASSHSGGSSSSAVSGGSAPVDSMSARALAPFGGYVARPDYVYTLDENFSFERVRIGS